MRGAPPGPVSGLLPALAFLVTTFCATPALAAWPDDPNVNLPVCTAPGDQWNPGASADGMGGTLILWDDARGGVGSLVVHGQRLGRDGEARWPESGLSLPWSWPRARSDGAGGVMGTCVVPEIRAPDPGSFGTPAHIDAWRVDETGVLRGDWRVEELIVPWGGVQGGSYSGVSIAPAGGTGLLIGTSGEEHDISHSRYFARVWRCDTNGASWSLVRLENLSWVPYAVPAVMPDDAGGNLVVTALGGGFCPGVSRYDAACAVVWDWSLGCDERLESGWPIPDGTGGAFVMWDWERPRVQHIGPDGAPLWGADGIEIAQPELRERLSRAISDRAGGLIFAWTDTTAGGIGIRANRFRDDGTLAWGPSGKVVCDAAGDRGQPLLVPDSTGGAILVWQDRRNGDWDIYAQHILADGTSAWIPDGRPVSTAAGDQTNPGILAVEGGSVIAVWEDGRSGIDRDIYAQLITRDGSLGAVHVAFDFKPHDLHLNSKARWVTGYLRAPEPFRASQIDVGSIRLNGAVAVSSEAPTTLEDHDSKLKVKFSRAEVGPTLAPGDHVPVTVTGLIAGEPFTGTDWIKVKAPKIHTPKKGDLLAGGATATVAWDAPEGVVSVTLLASLDDGVTWTIEAENIANTGSFPWTVPNVSTSEARVEIMVKHAVDETGVVPESEFAVSDAFTIATPADVVDSDARLALRPVNPAVGGLTVRFSLAAGPATLDVFDIGGRQVAARAVGSSGPGWHTLDLGGFPAGVYVVRLSQAGRSLSSRAAVIR